MTALVLHTALTVVLIVWAYMVTSRIPYRPAWIWTGTTLVVLVGYLWFTANSVFDGTPARVQAIVSNVGATLLVLAVIVCLALYGAVSRGPRHPIAARGAAVADSSGWAPRNEEPVIVPDDSEGWEPGFMIDSGTWPSGPSADDEPQAGRYAYPSADEAEASPEITPAHDSGSPVVPAAPPATAVYQPIALPRVAAAEPPTASSADEDDWEPIAPRRALPSPTDMRE